jgi:carbonic anhydrase
LIDAFIVRNAGGRLKSSITDLIFIETFTQRQALKDIVIIHHTGKYSSLDKPPNLTKFLDCGFTHNTDEAIKNSLKAHSPHLAGMIDQLYFGTFGSSDK